MVKDIPIFSLQRLPVYLNYLRSLPAEGNIYISSGAIAQALGLGEVLVRKDLAYTPCVGRPKVGYVREELIAALEEYLCCNDKKSAVIVGVGGIGRALMGYGGFVHYGIDVPAAFDNDPKKIGAVVAGKPVLDVNDLKSGCEKYGASLAIVAVPAAHAQEVADKLASAGIRAILNFAPTQIKAAENIRVINIDVAANLAVLASMV